MKVSLNWLKEYIDFSGKEQSVPSLFNNRTMEVEKIISYGDKKNSFEKIIVGEVKMISPHLQNQNFAIAEVYAGEKIGLKTVVFTKEKAEISIGEKPLIATKGAVFEDGLKIREKSIVGIVSEAAFCSEKELGLSQNASSILKFPLEPVGKSAFEIFELNDIVLEFDLEPNRPDLFGIEGFAYELSAILDRDIKFPPVDGTLELIQGLSYSKDPGALKVNVESKDLIPAYIAVLIDNIKIRESNSKIKNKLIKSGIRPVNNIVDLTNLVMIELSQPLHVFDRSKLHNGNIFAKAAKGGEPLITLDGKERKLSEGDIIIADEKHIIAIAGIMGGKDSMVDENSTSIIVESANFNMFNIRKTSRLLSVRTDASTRFEKGISPLLTIKGLNRFIYLLKEIMPQARIICHSYDILKVRQPGSFTIYFNELYDFLGQEIEKNKVVSGLRRLGFEVSASDDKIETAAPFFRSDINCKIDIFEEIFRIYGYEKIKSSMPYGILAPPEKNINYETAKNIKDLLRHLNFIEIITPSFTGKKELDVINEDRKKVLELKNPISVEYAYMRTNLIPEILKAVSQNLKSHKYIKLFEVGKVYINDASNSYPVLEKNRVCGALCSGIKLDGVNTEFYRIKGVIEFLLKNFNIKRFVYISPKDNTGIFELNKVQEFLIGKVPLGIFGEIKENILKEFDIDYKIGIFDMDMDAVKEYISSKKVFTPLSKYPLIEQDISIISNNDTPYGKIEKFIKGFSGLIKNVRLIDIYKGKQVESGKVAYLIRYDASESSRTLTMQEVNILRDSLIKELNKEFGIVLRGQN